MTALRTPLKKGSRPTRPYAARPRVEELEDRNLLSSTPLQVASEFVHSAEGLRHFVTNEYQTFLHRAPDAAGLDAWVSRLEHGATYEQVDAGFAASGEYVNAHGGLGTGWVDALYQDFLHRAADPAGEAFWALQAMAKQSESGFIALDFATSAERDGVVVTSNYVNLLGRQPEAGAVAAWQLRMEQGLDQQGLLTQFLGSGEFFQHVGNTDTALITALYQDVLGRTPSSAEVNQWLGLMGSTTQGAVGAASGKTVGDPTLLTVTLKPLDINLLGLEVKTNQIQVTVSTQIGDGQLLGNLLTVVSNLVNLPSVNTALNNVLGSVVDLLNSASLNVSGVNTTSGPLSTSDTTATTPVLTAHVAPVHLNLLGAVVDTSPIDLSIVAHSGPGLVLGNVVTDLANLFNPPLPKKLDIDSINQALTNLLAELNAQIPNIAPAPITTGTLPAGTEQVLQLIVPPINLNLLGLILKTDQIQVNANAVTGNSLLLGNVLTTLLNTLGATPDNLQTLNNNLNALLAKVVGVLNATSLVLPANALGTLSQVLQTLALPDLVNTTGTPATAQILNLTIASPDGTTPPVDVNLLGLQIQTSNIHAQLLAQTGDGQILGNLLFNVANLLNPGGSLGLLTVLNLLGL